MFNANDTAVSTDVAMLDSMDKVSQEIAVTGMFEQANQWLERADQGQASIYEVKDFSAYIATAVEAAKQKRLSEEIVLRGQKTLRRSEVSLGRKVREGQEAGAIVSQGTNPKFHEVGKQGSVSRSSATDLHDNRVSPKQFFTNAQQAHEIYALADAPEEVVSEAFDNAESDRNFSRANVVRHVKQIKQRDESAREAHREDMQAWHESLAARYPLPRLAFEAEGYERHSTVEALATAARDTYGVKYAFTEKSYAKHAATSQDRLYRASISFEAAIRVFEHIDLETITKEQADEALQRIDTRQFNLIIRSLKEISNG